MAEISAKKGVSRETINYCSTDKRNNVVTFGRTGRRETRVRSEGKGKGKG